MAAPSSSLDHLDTVNFNLAYNNPMQDVNAALIACSNTLRHWHAGVAGPLPILDTLASRAQFYTGDIKWHEFALVLNQREVMIYDPSYVHQAPPTLTSRRNLKSLLLIGTKAYKMIMQLKNTRKLVVDKVFVSGGGNLAGQCREMSLQWICQGVEQMVTTEKWVLGLIWERVNLA